MVRAGLHPRRRDTGLVRLLLIRAVAPCHDPEWDHLARLCRRRAAGSRRARPRRRARQASGATILRRSASSHFGITDIASESRSFIIDIAVLPHADSWARPDAVPRAARLGTKGL